MKYRVIMILVFFQYQISIAQKDSLRFGLKGKIIRVLANSSISSSEFYAGLKGKRLGAGLIYHSNDFGNTWIPLHGGKPIGPYVSDIQSISVGNDSKETIYAGTWKNGLYKTKDKGKTWERDMRFPTSDVRDIKTGIQNSNLVYAATSAFGVVKSIDGGNNWKRCRPKTIDSTFKFAWAIEIDKRNDSIIYALTYFKGVWKSIDQGETWEKILDTKRKVCWDMKISKDSKEIWVASSKRRDSISSIYHSVDEGDTWTEIPNTPQIGINQINILEESDKNSLIIGGWQKGIFVLRKENWVKIDSIDFEEISEILVNDNGLLIGTWGNGIYHTKL
ncbi:WD40/YVTN/BNR-like repeat-containing protein [Aquimarina spongiae]|uniref:BNR/Asp-box repeat-containing protein n=1 Tax=Aquimarina spongiae TaxID=570521 RepID=A0A1M6EAA7_9FLAO|nr:hypothetical protein [Aquimarina spongiae]SHI82218.1 Uncharacterized protein SAMN04488508_103299 [Aquimarina spongiae]